jgi:multiple sugar transport system permease protein
MTDPQIAAEGIPRARPRPGTARTGGQAPRLDASRPPLLTRSSRRRLTGAALTAPALLVIAVFFLVPLVLMLWMSFNDWPMMGGHHFIGFANYSKAFQDGEFGASVWFTVKYTLITTPVLFLLGLGMALLVRGGRRGARFFQTVWFLPVVIGLAASSFLWLYLFQSDFGPASTLLGHLGLGKASTNWFADSWSALLIVIAMVTWKVVGLQMLLLLAGLRAIPADVEEAARIDGAGRWQTMRYVIMPLLRPTLALVLVFSVAGSLLAFDQFYVMTSGGPSNQTITAVFDIYRASFVKFQLGYGSALSTLLMLVLIVVSAVQMWLLRSSEETR